MFIPRFLEGQSAVTIQRVACGDFFTACLTGLTLCLCVCVRVYVLLCLAAPENLSLKLSFTPVDNTDPRIMQARRAGPLPGQIVFLRWTTGQLAGVARLRHVERAGVVCAAAVWCVVVIL